MRNFIKQLISFILVVTLLFSTILPINAKKEILSNDILINEKIINIDKSLIKIQPHEALDTLYPEISNQVKILEETITDEAILEIEKQNLVPVEYKNKIQPELITEEYLQRNNEPRGTIVQIESLSDLEQYGITVTPPAPLYSLDLNQPQMSMMSTIQSFNFESPHPYSANLSNYYWSINGSGLGTYRIYFETIDVENNWDSVVVTANGLEKNRWSGYFQGVWSNSGSGETRVYLNSDSSIQKWGFKVTMLEYNIGYLPPSDDHSNSTIGATYLPVGYNNNPTPIAGTINPKEDLDYFYIQPTESTEYEIYTTGNFDSYGSLYNASNSLLSTNDDGNGNLQFKIRCFLSAYQTYYIQVKSYANASTGSYVIYAKKSTSSSGVPVTGIQISPSYSYSYPMNIYGATTYSCSAYLNPSNATNQTVTWSTDNSSIATVNSSGLVTFLRTGLVRIRATSAYSSSIYADTYFNVVTVGITGINPSSGTYNIEKGQLLYMNPSVSPAGATNTTLSWSTYNSSIATVSSSGVITGVNAGTTTIKATSIYNSNIYALYTVTVTDPYSLNWGYFFSNTSWNNISSDYGPRSSGFHNGIDVIKHSGTISGTPVLSATDGEVTKVYYYNLPDESGNITPAALTSGFGVVIKSNDTDPIGRINKLQLIYCHFSERPRKLINGVYTDIFKYDYINKGTQIGKVGDTGNTSGAHLHFAVTRNGEYWDQGNPINNTIDPKKFYPNIFSSYMSPQNSILSENNISYSHISLTPDQMIDIELVDYIGEEKFLEWANSPNTKVDIYSYKEHFNISNKKFIELCDTYQLYDSYDVNKVTSNKIMQ